MKGKKGAFSARPAKSNRMVGRGREGGKLTSGRSNTNLGILSLHICTGKCKLRLLTSLPKKREEKKEKRGRRKKGANSMTKNQSSVISFPWVAINRLFPLFRFSFLFPSVTTTRQKSRYRFSVHHCRAAYRREKGVRALESSSRGAKKKSNIPLKIRLSHMYGV